MNVSAILDTKGREVATVGRDATIAEALAILAERRIGALVVTGAHPPFAGIFSERDAVRALAAGGPGALEDPVAAHMSSEVSVCAESTDLLVVLATMTERRFRHVPVVEGGQLVGLVSIGDVVKARIEETQHEAEALKAYIVAG